MSSDESLNYTDFKLPPSVVVKLDVARLVNEIEQIDSRLSAASVREKVGVEDQVGLVISPAMEEFLQLNDLNIDDPQLRLQIIKQLRALKNNVPVIHMTFSVTADPESLQKIVSWLRESVHQQAVISVGLQPAIVAGVYMRTQNHIHDLSLRSMLKGQHDVLLSELKSLNQEASGV